MRPQENGQGFTLIEVVIALALSALVMLGLVSALAGLGATATRIDERAGQSDRQWLVNEFLRATLSTATGQLKYTRADGSKSVYFHGAPQTLEWLGSMPARYGVGGMHHFRLLLQHDDSATGERLVLQYAPYISPPPGSLDIPVFDTTNISTHVLATEVSGFSLAYQSKPEREDEDAVWSDDWDNAERTPGRVRVQIEAENAAWPPLVTALGAVDAAGTSGGSSWGAGRR
ncbi:type II secretion system protein J [Betaproteobacteria bacterium]|nr:type II secretion system protein J [Betaproteobacteria bacterium]GHU20122.1 type II secretion system protein J [Betaproteobacteria bacterium]